MIKQPNSRSCFACGAENPHGLQLKFYTVGVGEVVSHTVVPEKFQGYPGIVQGGIVATMLDEITLRAHLGDSDPQTPNFLFTARLDVRYRKPVPTNQPLKIVGKALKSKSRTATSHGYIYGPGGELLAEADAMLIRVPDKVLDEYDADVLGWKVYPDEPLAKGV